MCEDAIEEEVTEDLRRVDDDDEDEDEEDEEEEEEEFEFGFKIVEIFC